MRWVKLGDYIESFKQKSGDKNAIVSGVDINKQFIKTRANLEEVDVSKYYKVPPMNFACNFMHIGRDERIPIAFNDSNETLVVTAAYYVFHIKSTKNNELLNEYLYIFFNTSEIDRLAWFYTDSSIRGNLTEARFLEIKIPLPSIEEQRKVVAVWKGLKNLKEQNEQLAQPLMDLCQSYIEHFKNIYPLMPIQSYMKRGSKNSDNKIVQVLGIGQSGFIKPQKIPNESLKNYKILKYNSICYAPPLYNILSDAIHLYKDDKMSVCSPIYEVFSLKEDKIIPEYLLLWLKRKEFKRYAEFYSLGVRNTFDYNLMEEVKIPLPPIEVQQAIVNIYHCAKEAKDIAGKAAQLINDICPALMQHVIGESQ